MLDGDAMANLLLTDPANKKLKGTMRYKDLKYFEENLIDLSFDLFSKELTFTRPILD